MNSVNENNIASDKFINYIHSARLRRTTAMLLLQDENTELIRIIADFDARLATVEAERDALRRKLDGYHCTARNTRIVDIRELDLAAHKVVL